MRRYFWFVTSHPVAVLCLAGVVGLVLGPFVLRLTRDTSPDAFIPPEHEALGWQAERAPGFGARQCLPPVGPGIGNESDPVSGQALAGELVAETQAEMPAAAISSVGLGSTGDTEAVGGAADLVVDDATRDADGDGVPDDDDTCPGTPQGTDVDTNGCPVVGPSPTPIPDDDDEEEECGNGVACGSMGTGALFVLMMGMGRMKMERYRRRRK